METLLYVVAAVIGIPLALFAGVYGYLWVSLWRAAFLGRSTGPDERKGE